MVKKIFKIPYFKPKIPTPRIPTPSLPPPVAHGLKRGGEIANKGKEELFKLGDFARRALTPQLTIYYNDCNKGISLVAPGRNRNLYGIHLIQRNPDCKPPAIFDPPPKITINESLPDIPPKTDNGFYIYYNPYTLIYFDGGINSRTKKTASGYFSEETYTKITKAKFSNSFQGEYEGLPYNMLIEMNVKKVYAENMVTLSNRVVNINDEFITAQKDWGLTLTGSVREPYTFLKGSPSCTITYYCDTAARDFRVKYSENNNFFVNQVPLPRLIDPDVDNAYVEQNLKNYFVVETRQGNGWTVRNLSDLEKEVKSKFYPRELTPAGSSSDIFGAFYYGMETLVFARARKYEIVWVDDFEILPPPPPPPMTCNCCPNIQQNDELLRLILKKIGSADLPATVPTYLTNASQGTTKIENLAQFTAYAVKQIDAVSGKYPIEVKIKDSDLTQQGDQEKTLKIPNIAEGLAELLGLMLMLKAESSATLSAAVRGMIEAGSGKQAAILAHDYAKANAEFLGYSGKQIKRKVPFAFNFNKQKLDEMLAEGEFEIKGFDNDDKDDFGDKIMPLLDMAAMYRAANFRKVNAGNPGASIKAILDGYNSFDSQTKTNIDDPRKEREKGTKNPENWDSFLESAERGFIEEPGIKNSTDPYDRPFDQRPRIREIGNDTSDTED